MAPVTALATAETAAEAHAGDTPVLALSVLTQGVPLEALRTSGSGPAWTPVEDGLPGEVAVSGLATGETAAVTLFVEGPAPFVFWAGAQGPAEVRFSVNGVTRFVALSSHLTAYDLHLPEGVHNLTWTALAHSPEAVGRVVLKGATGFLAPYLAGIPSALQTCGVHPLRFVMTSAVPLAPDGVEVALGGIALPANVTTTQVDLRLQHEVSVDLSAFAGKHGRWPLDLRVRDTFGTVWDYGSRFLTLDARVLAFAEPHGWVYTLRPTVRAVALCELSATSLTLQVGAQVVSPVVRGTLASFTFDRDLAFNETVPYAFEVTLPEGRTQRLEGFVREGLDVLEFNLSSGALVVSPFPAGAAVGNPSVPEELPVTLSTDPRAPPMQSMAATVPPQGLRVRALYAPLALVCTDPAVFPTRTCSPYGGPAPGFYSDRWITGTTLTAGADTSVGHVRGFTVGGAGQLAAASYFSRPEAPALPELPPIELPEAPGVEVETDSEVNVKVEARARAAAMLRVGDLAFPLRS
ncbi:MAG TPA: hypothetical protein VNZ52_12040 [Candidatus Thermoplasmatota archaeon]|nr:hypothetical protein [Candidatus Thermoplasmatota archaeon]